MLKRSYTYVLLLCLASSSLYANDLNDGIGIDEEINDDLQINPNIDFIKRNAIAKARRVNLSNNKGATSVCIDR